MSSLGKDIVKIRDGQGSYASDKENFRRVLVGERGRQAEKLTVKPGFSLDKGKRSGFNILGVTGLISEPAPEFRG